MHVRTRTRVRVNIPIRPRAPARAHARARAQRVRTYVYALLVAVSISQKECYLPRRLCRWVTASTACVLELCVGLMCHCVGVKRLMWCAPFGTYPRVVPRSEARACGGMSQQYSYGYGGYGAAYGYGQSNPAVASYGVQSYGQVRAPYAGQDSASYPQGYQRPAAPVAGAVPTPPTTGKSRLASLL